MYGTVTTIEAAEIAGVGEFTIRQWVARGHLSPCRAEAKPLRFREWDVVCCAAERMPRCEHDRLDALWQELLAAERAMCHDSA